MAAVAQWPPGVRYPQLQAILMGSAQDLSQGPMVDAILASLRLRYGLTLQEARGQLEAIKRDPQTPFQEHSGVMEKLAQITYTGVPEAHQLEMVTEKFLSSLGNLGLRRHLLGVPTSTMEAAVHASNKYLQLTATHCERRVPGGHCQVAGEASENEDATLENRVDTIRDSPIETLQKVLADLM